MHACILEKAFEIKDIHDHLHRHPSQKILKNIPGFFTKTYGKFMENFATFSKKIVQTLVHTGVILWMPPLLQNQTTAIFLIQPLPTFLHSDHKEKNEMSRSNKKVKNTRVQVGELIQEARQVGKIRKIIQRS
jgi:hypothetical protein